MPSCLALLIGFMFLKSYYVSQIVLELLGSKGTPASILEQGLQSLPNATDFNWFYLFFKLGFIFFLRHVLTMKTRLTLNLVCSPGWPWQHYNDSPASWVLELQLCVTIPSLILFCLRQSHSILRVSFELQAILLLQSPWCWNYICHLPQISNDFKRPGSFHRHS